MVWNTKSTLSSEKAPERLDEIVDILLKHRQINSKAEKDNFLNPLQPTLTTILRQLPDLNQNQLNKAVKRIKKAISSKEPIIIYGDYDCDGVCSTAIIWKTLHQLGANALPFIPHRTRHGYGLSEAGLDEALCLFPKKTPLIITVDNGISAVSVAKKLKDKSIDLIITDHHTPPSPLPSAFAIVHTTTLSGSGVSWLLSASLTEPTPSLELAALGTVCDLLPLTGPNRSIVKHGIDQLRTTTSPGLKALYSFSGVTEPSSISTYHLGYVIGPRINAVGRLDHALDALRLLCTNQQSTANTIAERLSQLNTQRQDLTNDHATQAINHFKQESQLPNILFISHPEYHEGIIGLIASRLTDFFHRPAIVASVSDDAIKASARSIPGVNITSIISKLKKHLTNYGGHEQAAGFSAPPENLETIANYIMEEAKDIDPNLLIKTLDVEIELSPSDLTFDLLKTLNKFEPFGIDNPKPIFTTTVPVNSHILIGKTKTHLKLALDNPYNHLDVIGFNLANKSETISKDTTLAFSLQENNFRGNTSLQLLVKDIAESQLQ